MFSAVRHPIRVDCEQIAAHGTYQRTRCQGDPGAGINGTAIAGQPAAMATGLQAQAVSASSQLRRSRTVQDRPQIWLQVTESCRVHPLSPVAIGAGHPARVYLPARGDFCPAVSSPAGAFFIQRHTPSSAARRMCSLIVAHRTRSSMAHNDTTSH